MSRTRKTAFLPLSHYRIEPVGPAWAITVNRFGGQPETIPANTFPEACRLARPFSDNGLPGYVNRSGMPSEPRKMLHSFWPL